eukprot:TRINITY_DN1994_c0_g1_i9.p1 TRINITY_DN1994_c0_g1~~TRINITY_DN1994_c0_g1_i9.p1  ORF type:complete len:106 (-),score=11.79 TRINITY_DN1994_c0_g1_i9:100-417(-)
MVHKMSPTYTLRSLVTVCRSFTDAANAVVTEPCRAGVTLVVVLGVHCSNQEARQPHTEHYSHLHSLFTAWLATGYCSYYQQQDHCRDCLLGRVCACFSAFQQGVF